MASNIFATAMSLREDIGLAAQGLKKLVEKIESNSHATDITPAATSISYRDVLMCNIPIQPALGVDPRVVVRHLYQPISYIN